MQAVTFVHYVVNFVEYTCVDVLLHAMLMKTVSTYTNTIAMSWYVFLNIMAGFTVGGFRGDLWPQNRTAG